MMNRRINSSVSSNRQGMILIVVMMVIVLVSLAGYNFLGALYTENKAVRLRGDVLQAQNLVASGVDYLKATIVNPPLQEDDFDLEGSESENQYKGILVFGEEDDTFRGRFSILSPNLEAETPAKFKWGPGNESAKLNLHAVAHWEKQNPGSGKEALLQLPQMTESIAGSILDWMDEDSIAREQGAESEFYEGLKPSYAARNAVPLSLDELLLVKDITRDMLYGRDLNHDFYTSPKEQQRQGSDDLLEVGTDEASIPWNWLLTVHSAERIEDESGKPLINVNSKNLSELHQQLISTLGKNWADFIIIYRQFGPLDPLKKTDADKLQQNPPQSASSIKVDLKLPAKFQIQTLLDLVGANVHVPSKNKPAPDPKGKPPKLTLFKSPLGTSSESMQSGLPDLFAKLTVYKEQVVIGRVNMNEAPIEVLKCVPGVDEALALSIVNNRNGQFEGEEETKRAHPTWLLTNGLVSLTKMKEILPYFTDGGDVIQAQIVGFFDHGPPSARAEVIIDGTQRPVRLLYWNDLRMHGLAFPLEFLGADVSILEEEAAEQVAPASE